MKRMLLLLTMSALLLLAGCGQGPDSSQGGPSEPGFTREDLYLEVDGTRYRCDMNIEAVIADLGEDYRYAEGMSCDYDGLDKSFLYDRVQFYTNPLSEGDLVNEIFTESAQVATSRGIAVGATREEVLAAYGEDCEDEGDLLIYRLEGERAALCFELENGAVWAIYLTTQPV